MVANSETDSVDELMLQNLGTNLMNRKKFRIDYSKIKTNKIRLDRIDLNDDQYELKKVKRLQESMSLSKLSGNNLDK